MKLPWKEVTGGHKKVTSEVGLKDQGMLAPGRGAERWEQQQESEGTAFVSPRTARMTRNPRADSGHSAGNTVSPAALQKSPGPMGGSLHLSLGPVRGSQEDHALSLDYLPRRDLPTGPLRDLLSQVTPLHLRAPGGNVPRELRLTEVFRPFHVNQHSQWST